MLNLEFAHGRYGGKSAKRPPWKWWILRWMFLVTKCKRKIRRKKPPENRQPKTKNPPVHDPPEIRQPGPQSRRKNLPTNPHVKPPSKHRVFLIEKDCSWRRLQSMDSGTLFGCLLGMVEAPMLKFTCNPSAAAGGMDKVCCTPFQTTLLVKSVRFEKRPKK